MPKQSARSPASCHSSNAWVVDQFIEADKVERRMGHRVSYCQYKRKRGKPFHKEDRHSLVKEGLKINPFNPKRGS